MKNAPHHLKNFLFSLLDAQVCLACGGPLYRRPLFVREEEAEGWPLSRSQAWLCPSCLHQLPLRDPGWFLLPYSCLPAMRVFAYEGPVRALLLALKFRSCLQVGEALAPFAAYSLRQARSEPPFSPAALVPLPLSPARERQRGYNQAQILCQALGRALGLLVLDSLLVRKRDTRPQTKMRDWRARQANVQGAFALGREEAGLHGRPLLLVDDVLTSGATCREAALILKQAGYPVRVLAFAGD